MHPFALSRADNLGTAIAAHSQDPDLAFIAGGTDLIGLMKDHAILPERLLDINHLPGLARIEARQPWRSEEHTSELQSPEAISYAVFCLKKKKA